MKVGGLIAKNLLYITTDRTRAQWTIEGEKPTSCFCNLETKKFTSKIIPKLLKQDGSLITNQNEMISEAFNFYQKLYSKHSDLIDVRKYLDPNLILISWFHPNKYVC